MKFIIVTLFPEMFQGPLNESILKRAQEKGIIEFELINLRDFGLGQRKSVDDTPYGGGNGMVLRVDVMAAALEATKLKVKSKKPKVLLMTPQGETFRESKAKELASKEEDLILIAGHYEGFDERIRDLVDEQISIGDYVLTGGEIPSMAVIDAVARLLPGVLGTDESSADESHSIEGEIEYPQYTRPEEWEGKKVPEILLSGNHQRIAEWRHEQTKARSKKQK